ncbi:ClpP/crotonase-like domain-containing protein [Tribonema minus]|uniref:ATP-dependent Clp protease proteolytic subunit n=1 Tax=Tribonema minus TaxID=303371 RepID=A0A835Z7Z6_9STRA|nr:ClpP/crotonase-like domain-containing protein [Tribonema minus]
MPSVALGFVGLGMHMPTSVPLMSRAELIKYGGATFATYALALPGPSLAEAAEEPEYGAVERVNNKIYMYAEVSAESCAMIRRAIADATQELQQYTAALSISHPLRIELHIQSQGGALMPTFGLVDYICRNPVPIDSFIDGYAASAATLISVSCAKRYAYRNSIMLLHQLSGGASGKFADIEQQVSNMDLFMSMIRNIYLDRTAMNRSEIDEVLATDEWFSARVCLEKGIIDEILA